MRMILNNRNRILVVTVCLLSLVHAFDLGFTPRTYSEGEKVDLLVNKIESDNTQLPYSYAKLPFVCPTDSNPLPLSIGQVLQGDRIWNSNYELRFGMDMPCMRLCDLISRDSGLRKAESLIKQGYVAHWSIDGLPGATTFVSFNNKQKYYAAGFPLGFVQDDVSYIYNHVMLVIRFHRDKATDLRSVVGFEVYPKSVSNEKCPGSSKDYKNFPLLFPKEEPKDKTAIRKTIIPYTYSVYWREDNTIDYESRWDLFYENESNNKNHNIHWLSFVNSVILIFLVSLIVAMVLMRVLKKDIQSSSPALPTTLDYDKESENSWKSLINNINDKPKMALCLSVFVASGIQMLVAAIGVIGIFVVNTKFNMSNASSYATFFNNHQGAFFSYSLFCLVTSAVIASYFGVIVHKVLHNHHLNQEYSFSTTMALSVLFSGFLPTMVLLVVLFLNFFVWAKESSNALPFGTIIVLLLLFLIIELPLGVAGGVWGNKRKFTRKSVFLTSPSPDNKDTSTSKYRGRSAAVLSPILSIFIFGLIPFGVVYVELLFIFNSVWLEKTTFYYMYGFLFVTSLMLIIIIAESSIVAIYVSLAIYNNPNWQWLSFRVGSSIGWYIYGYSIYYFTLYLNIRDFVSILFYFGYMALACILIGFGCGAVGVLTGMFFIKRIFVKVD